MANRQLKGCIQMPKGSISGKKKIHKFFIHRILFLKKNPKRVYK